MRREDVAWLLPPVAAAAAPSDALLGSNARAAYEAFQRHGALFSNQLQGLLQLAPSQVEDVLGELAAAGLITSDGYPALRKLLGTQSRKRRGHPRPRLARPIESPAGRWTLLRSELTPAIPSEERAELWCRLLLRRYGVMFRDLLASESAAPPWSDLVRNYRRLEARGEIRGGRFVSGVAGEQYALPEIITQLRAAVVESDDLQLVLPATDPLNLSGFIDASPRVPAQVGRSIVIAQGQIQLAGGDAPQSGIDANFDYARRAGPFRESVG